MPKRPRGEKRPADAIGFAVIGETKLATSSAAAALGSLGGKARARKLTAAERQAIAKRRLLLAGKEVSLFRLRKNLHSVSAQFNPAYTG